MTVEQVTRILELYTSGDYSDKLVYSDNWLKRNKRLDLNKLEEFVFVRTLIEDDLKKVNKNFRCSKFISLLEYNKGGYFSPHKDSSYTQYDKFNPAVYSGGYLLNTDYSGGEFIVENKVVESNIGELILFKRDVEHCVNSITNGVRYSIHFAVNSTSEKKII